ncbi:cysteine desulfurase family protein [Methylacidiphilum caldifontis]|uniref:cysteine desulfurase n=1 Tax=Methylacidiphilum caldifontis TaxID=2795386 RepID=A0A4Y8P9C2_9BACT|nr:cysteine desulfurase family protein [Methylacidiphilum caldifontis]QSR89477.1 cysteine desulfurase [Methylacidiphilum caldifontis]TFE67271.1 cysteine desulfurase NifS [Methylacidiphilum caldifontis]
MKGRVYLDYNATTPLSEEVFEAMIPWLRSHFGNPSSSHDEGRKAKEALIQSRKKVAQFLGVKAEEIIFTSGCTESIAMAIKGVLSTTSEGKNKIVISAVEHPAVLSLLKQLEKENVQSCVIGVDRDGSLRLDELEKALDSSVILVSLLWANNETGVIFPIKEIGLMAKARGIPFHVDGAQVVGKILIQLSDLEVDLFSFSAHKLYGPKGIGVLYKKKGLKLSPLIAGHQERQLRGGTENVAAVVGMAKACEIAESTMNEQALRLQKLRDWMEKEIQEQLPEAIIVGKNNRRIGNTSNIIFPGVDAEELLSFLDRNGVAVSTGSACTRGSQQPSHVLLAMGFDSKQASSALRISMGYETTQKEIEMFLHLLSSFLKNQASLKTPQQAKEKDEEESYSKLFLKTWHDYC